MANAKKWYTTGLTATEAKKMGMIFGRVLFFNTVLGKDNKLQMQVKLKLQDGSEETFKGGSADDIVQIMLLTGARADFHMKNNLVEVYKNGSIKGLGVNEHIGKDTDRR